MVDLFKTRLSLGAFLTAIVLLGLCFAFVIALSHRAAKQRSAVSWVENHGGFVFYRYETSKFLHYYPDPLAMSPSGVYNVPPPVPYWLLNAFDIHYFSDVTAVQMYDLELETTQPLHDLIKLEYLDIRETTLSPTQLNELRTSLPNCEIETE